MRPVAAQVFGKRCHRAIALTGQLAQGLRGDLVQVTLQLMAQGRRGGGARQHLCIGLQRGAHHFCRGAAGRCCGVATTQQLVQQHAQCIDISRGGDRLPTQLLWRCVLRCEHAPAIARKLGGFCGCGFIFQQLGNAKVQQFDGAVRGHQDVAGFDVAVNHQVGVGMGHGGQHFVKQGQFGLNA